MSWELVVGFNAVISACYVAIASLILSGLIRTRQLRTNKLALATALIFATCALHHWAHGLHLIIPEGGGGQAGLEATRETYSGVHNVLIEVLGAAVAVTYLGLRRNYKALLNTPAMFDDAVRAAAEERLRVMAFTDLLTGVPNRAAYQAFADGMVGDPRSVQVLFVDLDGFKKINDQYGHDFGDRLLREVAQRLVRGLASGERLFRVGGDEFLVMGVDHADGTADGFVARVRELIRLPLSMREGEVSIDASIGVAVGADGSRVDELVREADVAMYQIKATRRSAALSKDA
ncbi:MAG: diguanylate cyclase [Aeromicrobium sp.]|nr:diguanylate cyclase [Aeromicrobium sp.]